jgi:hypothetical protein
MSATASPYVESATVTIEIDAAIDGVRVVVEAHDGRPRQRLILTAMEYVALSTTMSRNDRQVLIDLSTISKERIADLVGTAAAIRAGTDVPDPGKYGGRELASMTASQLQKIRPARRPGAMQGQPPYYDRYWFVPWIRVEDHRPGSKVPRWEDQRWIDEEAECAARGTMFYTGSARKGECTLCLKQDKIVPCTHRVTNENGDTQYSVCQIHFRKLAKPPLDVPEFDSPEEAQAWLDKMSDELESASTG